MKVSRLGNIYNITLESEADKSVYPVFDRPIAEAHIFILDAVVFNVKYPTIGGYPKKLNLAPFLKLIDSYPATVVINVDKYGDFENPDYWAPKDISQGV